jgi:hypothetical protein
MQTNVRSTSTSPPPIAEMNAEDVPDYYTWITCHTFFLLKEYTLETIEPFKMFTFECTNDQVIRNSDGNTTKTVYDMHVRFWKKTAEIMYYIRRVVHVKNILTVTFVRQWLTGKRRDEFSTQFELADSFYGLSNPFLQDNMPRQHAIQTFQRFRDKQGKPMTVAHIVRFFNALHYILIMQSCKMDRNAIAPSSQYTEARLKRMTNVMMSTWDTYPEFAKRFRKSPIPIEDQQFSRMKDPESSFGSMVVLLEIIPQAEDYLPMVKPDKNGEKDLSYVTRMLAKGLDPIPGLLKKLSPEEREDYPTTIKLVEELRW